MRLLVALFVCVVGSPLSVTASENEQVKAQKALEGRWVIVSVAGAGTTLSEAELKRVRRGFLFEDGTAKSFFGDTIRAAGKFSVDSATTPKRIDITLTPEGAAESETVLGLYKLDKDRLTLCNRLPGEERPTEFGSNATTMVSVYEREKR